MATYQPLFTDPRVRSRCLQAIGWASAALSATKSRAWSTRHIDKYFGGQSHDISKYLRKTLLIETNSYWNKDIGQCKEYRLNIEGVNYLSEKLGLDSTEIHNARTQRALEDHSEELVSGEFQYLDKSNRLWHPLQKYRKPHRNQILKESGYLHDYDIMCAAPTLLHQYAQQQGMDLYLFALTRYLNNRDEIRKQLSRQIELPIEAVKEIITALFAGAVISKNTKSDIYHILNGDIARIEYLKQDPYVTELRNDIKICWEYIRPSIPKRTRLMPNGKERLCRINSKQKWNIYFELERQVMNSVRTYLDEHSVRYFLIHDGWTCDREIDRDLLRDYVRDHTGFDLKFDYCFFV